MESASASVRDGWASAAAGLTLPDREQLLAERAQTFPLPLLRSATLSPESLMQGIKTELRSFQHGPHDTCFHLAELIDSLVQNVTKNNICLLSNVGYPDGGDGRLVLKVQGEFCRQLRDLLPAEIEIKALTQKEYEQESGDRRVA